jgi:hypothetical protein
VYTEKVPISDALGPLPATGEAAPATLLPGEKERSYPSEAEPHDGARAYRALIGELIRRSRDVGALVLFVDDVQWADPATLGFLAYAAKRVPGERILLVASYRREDAHALSGWLDHLAERRASVLQILEQRPRAGSRPPQGAAAADARLQERCQRRYVLQGPCAHP